MSNHPTSPSHIKSGIIKKALKITACTLGAIVALIIIFFVGVNLYLTPARLSDIISREGSKYLNAQVKVSNVSYTFWSTFPNLHVRIDSLSINSRALKNLPTSIRHKLPDNCDFLASTGAIEAGLNVIKTLKGEIDLKEIKISSPKVNLVSYNDSINNYSIFPRMHPRRDITHVSIDAIDISAPVVLSYSDVMSQSSADVKINRFTLAKGDIDNTYAMSVSAIADGNIKNVSIPQASPIDINGTIRLQFDPITIYLKKFAIDFAGIKTSTDLDMIAGETPVINSLSTDISVPDALPLFNMFPDNLSDNLKNINGHLPLAININLTEPFCIKNANSNRISMSNLPAFTTNIEVKNAGITYSISQKREFNFSDINLSAFLDIDPRKNEANRLEIYNCSLLSDGSEFSFSGSAKELLNGNPLINADIKCLANISKLTKIFMSDSPLKMEGSLNGNTNISCHLADLTEKKVRDLTVDGNFKSKNLKITDTAKKLIASISGVALDIRAVLPSLSLDSLSDGKMNLASVAEKTEIRNLADSSVTTLENARISAKLGAGGNISNPTVAGKADVKSDRIASSQPGMQFESTDIALNINASLRHSPWTPSSGQTFHYSSNGDSLIACRTRHTPLYLVAEIPPMMQSALSLLNIKADISAAKGYLLAEAYPAVNHFSNLNLSTDLDSLSIASLNLESRSSSAQISGKIKGLRQFLSSSSPALLIVDLDADFSDVNINELAGTYYAGVAKSTGKPVNFTVPPLGPYTAADSLCVAIPRNIRANLRLHSDRAEYQGWTFKPLSTELSLHDGVARIGNLNIGSGFCSASVDWTYSTKQLDDIFMHLNIGVEDFDFDKFFTAFPSLVAKTPELANLSGELSAKAEGEFLMFPDMFLNTPSLEGELTLSGDSIQYARDKKTARITHFLLLKGDGPLKIGDFTAHGSFHDNLLQVAPFSIKCGGYEIMLGGVNNLQGEIYYHLGLMHSPFHFPFGINLVGNYHHPEIRFGGDGIKDGRERKIAADLRESANVNIMRQLKHGWLLFIENAAKYDAKNNHDYVFNVP